MQELIPALSVEIFDPSYVDLGIDILEVGIDTVLTDGVLRDLPFVKTCMGIWKFGCAVRDRNLLVQTLTFIHEFNSRTISPEKLGKYKTDIMNDSKKAEKELGRVLVILDRIIDQSKSQFLSRAYAAYVNTDIGWDSFRELSDVIDRIFIDDIPFLKSISESPSGIIPRPQHYSSERLIAMGLVSNHEEREGNAVQLLAITQTRLALSPLGKQFCLYCI